MYNVLRNQEIILKEVSMAEAAAKQAKERIANPKDTIQVVRACDGLVILRG